MHSRQCTPICQPSSTVARSDTSIEAEFQPTSLVLCSGTTRRRLRRCRQHRRRSSGDTTPGPYSDTMIALFKDQFPGSAASSSSSTCLITGEKPPLFATPLLHKSTQVHLQHLLTLLCVTNLGSQVRIPSLHYCHAAVLHRLLQSILVAVTHAFQQLVAMTGSHQCNEVPGSPRGNLIRVQQFSTVWQPASMSPRHTPTRTSPHTPQRSQTRR